jgi:hypothetical protein
MVFPVFWLGVRVWVCHVQIVWEPDLRRWCEYTLTSLRYYLCLLTCAVPHLQRSIWQSSLCALSLTMYLNIHGLISVSCWVNKRHICGSGWSSHACAVSSRAVFLTHRAILTLFRSLLFLCVFIFFITTVITQLISSSVPSFGSATCFGYY